MGDICFSANTGRQHFIKRIAFVAGDIAALKISMEHYLNDSADENVTLAPPEEMTVPENTQGYTLREQAKFYCSGADLNWDELYPKEQFNKVILPTYPFQRKPFWFVPSEKGKQSIAPVKSGNPLLATTFSSPLEQKQFIFNISPENVPELNDTNNLMHVGYFIEMIKLNLNLSDFIIVFIEFISAITFVKGKEKSICLIVSSSGDALDLQFFSLDAGSSKWNLHVNAQIKPELANKPESQGSIGTIQSQCMHTYGSDAFYEGLSKRGVALGDSVKWIDTLWVNKGEALARFKQRKYNSGIWDACAQLFHAALADEEAMFMVHRWDEVLIASLPEQSEPLWCHLKLKDRTNPEILYGSFVLFNEQREVFIQCTDFEMHAVNQQWMAEFMRNDEDQEQEESIVLKQLGELALEQQIQSLCDYLIDSCSSVLAIPKDELGAKSILSDMGIDSIINLTLKNDFLTKTGINIPLNLLMESSTIETLAQSLVSLIAEKHQTPTVTKDKSSLWFTKPGRGSQKTQLFCFPYGGGGASLYKGWQEKMPENIIVVPVQLPGRENRFQEEPFTSIYPLIDTLSEIIGPECNKPFAFYGHSAGGLIAYRLMKRLTENPVYAKNCRQLFVAAYSSPLMHPNPWYQQFILKLQHAGFQGVPDLTELQQCRADQLAVFMELMELEINLEQYAKSEKDLEFIKLMLSKLMADLQLVESYQHKDAEPPLSVPITAFHGDADDRVNAEDMQAWKSLTSSHFHYVNFPGDHFFLHKNQYQDLLIHTIIKILLDDPQKKS
ncbi:thioesterase domain-containing protein [uncultured Legionella sp.]|uniref:thioesterase domain-containing protein n=1 Tax=uncultured Legionella sp. TaxID=210934 RepID=UPI002604B243|nr:thioesterase domain-containing protein [uncultured Legionella sp.]